MSFVVAMGSAALVPPSFGVARASVARAGIAQRTAVRMGVDDVPSPGDDECYLFDTEDEGRKYVCTSDPEELAWHLGLEMKDLKTGAKPDDLNLIECSEEWSHTGTPQWVCKEGKEEDDEELEPCELVGETKDELWFTCDEKSKDGQPGVTCEEEDFGTGGGIGILPQEGEVLCKQKKPKAAGPKFKVGA